MSSEGAPLVAFHVAALPRPKGSLMGQSTRGSTRVRMTESVDPEGVFRTAVVRAAYLAVTGRLWPGDSYRYGPKVPEDRMIRGPVETRMLFLLPEPRNAEWWAPAQARSGDIEKLVRNVHDALGDIGLYPDDAGVTTLGRVGKRFVNPELFDGPGAFIEVRRDFPVRGEALDEEWFAHSLAEYSGA